MKNPFGKDKYEEEIKRLSKEDRKTALAQVKIKIIEIRRELETLIHVKELLQKYL